MICMNGARAVVLCISEEPHTQGSCTIDEHQDGLPHAFGGCGHCWAVSKVTDLQHSHPHGGLYNYYFTCTAETCLLPNQEAGTVASKLTHYLLFHLSRTSTLYSCQVSNFNFESHLTAEAPRSALFQTKRKTPTPTPRQLQ